MVAVSPAAPAGWAVNPTTSPARRVRTPSPVGNRPARTRSSSSGEAPGPGPGVQGVEGALGVDPEVRRAGAQLAVGERPRQDRAQVVLPQLMVPDRLLDAAFPVASGRARRCRSR